MSGFNVNVNGTWNTAKKISVNVNGTWQPAKQAWVNVNGVWKSVYQASLPAFNLVTSTKGSFEYDSGAQFRSDGGNMYLNSSQSFPWKVGAETLNIYSSYNRQWQFNCWQNTVNGGILPKPNAYYFIRFYNSSYYNNWFFGYTNNGSLYLDSGSPTNLVSLGTVYRYNDSSPTYFKVATNNSISTDSNSAFYPRLFYCNYSSGFHEGNNYVDQLYCQEISQSDYNTKSYDELNAMYPWY